MKALATASCAVAFFVAALLGVAAAPSQTSLEDRYIASREAAIKTLKPLYDAGTMDEAGTKTEDAARADLEAQLRAIIGPMEYAGFGPGKLNLDSLYDGDEGFGALDGLQFDTIAGKSGATAGVNDAEGHYIEPKAHIIVTTQTLFARWLRAHKDWWDKGMRNVPQQMSAALKDDAFYTQAISTGAAVVKYNDLPNVRPAAAISAYGMLAARTQSDIPAAADEIYASALAKGKVYIAYGSVMPAVEVAACDAMRADLKKKSDDAYEALQDKRITQKAYDKLGDLGQKSEDAFRRCFAARAPNELTFAEVAKQAQGMLEVAVGK